MPSRRFAMLAMTPVMLLHLVPSIAMAPTSAAVVPAVRLHAISPLRDLPSSAAANKDIRARRSSKPLMLNGGDIASAVATLLGGAAGLVAFVATGSAALWYAQERDVERLRAQRQAVAPSFMKSKGVASSSPAFVQPREFWRAEELAAYDGTDGDDGPILLAADGLVFNVGSARKFYGPGGEYAVMAGKDASRHLGKNSVEEETEAERAVPLNIAERASLGAWLFSFKNKYDLVGRLATPEEAVAIDAATREREVYMERMEEMGLLESQQAERKP